ncbi:tetratricopeptide repeat protein [Aquimarina sp. D1M17]|uniref:tetratricopeptide repeat-containing sensor histidine kinase n=1 Tax=Aquimarina acroporae TaxID=2937283 RepID=UPI0020C022FF|nr:tetratricopeptide repeat-containing sensor histidine kinase [Aquimarina acroporae]MCK8523861.1 tetratricopeptide repeat protein [Aquimarina acroporae]
MIPFSRKNILFFCCILFGLNLFGQFEKTKLPPPSGKINTYRYEKKQLEQAHDFLGTPKELEAYNTSHRILKNTIYKSSIINASLLLGIYFNDRNLADSALFYGNRCVKILERGKDSISMIKKARAYNIIANAYGDKSLLEESKKWNLKGLKISQKYHDKKQYYRKLHNLASTYIRLKDYDYAIELLESCLTYKKDPELTFTSYVSLASIYSLKNKYDLALSFLKKSLIHFENKNDSESRKKVIVLQNIGVQYHLLKKYDDAISYYNKAYVIGKKKGYHRPTLDALTNIALIHREKENFEEAIQAYKEALIICEDLGFLDKQINIYANLKKIAKSTSNFKESIGYFEKEIEIKDSIVELQKAKEIRELEVKFKTEQKEKEIKILTVENTNRQLRLKNQEEAIKNLRLEQEIENKENENQILAFQNASEKSVNEISLLKKDQEIKKAELERQKVIKNTILYSFLVLLIPIIGLLIIYYQKLQAQSELNKKQKEIGQQKISALLKDQELAVIKASIKGQDKERKRIAQELHDSIGGNLAAIKLQLNHTKTNQNSFLQSINKQLDDTYHQVRSLSHTLIPKKFSENHFCDVIEEYLNNIGNGTDLQTSFEAYPRNKINAINQNVKLEIFKVIQELITNTIKHAKASSMDLQFYLLNNNLNILFEDNGLGFDVTTFTEGIGLRNIKNRLQGMDGQLNIDSRKNRGTIINIEINNLETNLHEV